MKKKKFYILIILLLTPVFLTNYNTENYTKKTEISNEMKEFLGNNFNKNYKKIPCGYQKTNYKNLKIGK